MDQLCEKYLNIPLDAVLHPASPTPLQAIQIQQAAAFAALQEPGELPLLVANVRSEGAMPEASRFDHNGLKHVERELCGVCSFGTRALRQIGLRYAETISAVVAVVGD